MPPRLNGKRIAPRRLRDAPEVFAVEQLRAIPGRGAFLKAAGNAGTVGQRWVVVTGLVPYKRQLAEYRAKFEGAGIARPMTCRNTSASSYNAAEVAPVDGRAEVGENHDPLSVGLDQREIRQVEWQTAGTLPIRGSSFRT